MAGLATTANPSHTETVYGSLLEVGTVKHIEWRVIPHDLHKTQFHVDTRKDWYTTYHYKSLPVQGVRVSRKTTQTSTIPHCTGTKPEHNKHTCLAHKEPGVPN
ncbi:hypothetical protein Taro_000272 [Colocasia esculenta]|uniref:Uncharacterized protein n=1 Tax=Colocasia esculenta TaxID=4460 RepID=A0A843T6K5_COLES|nr:hypothetical protein [Colocasia esculenta]